MGVIYVNHDFINFNCSHLYSSNGNLFVFCILFLIIYMKKLPDSDWLRAVQFKCNHS